MNCCSSNPWFLIGMQNWDFTVKSGSTKNMAEIILYHKIKWAKKDLINKLLLFQIVSPSSVKNCWWIRDLRNDHKKENPVNVYVFLSHQNCLIVYESNFERHYSVVVVDSNGLTASEAVLANSRYILTVHLSKKSKNIWSSVTIL